MIDAPHVKKSYFRVRKSSKFLAALVFTIFLLPYHSDSKSLIPFTNSKMVNR